MSAGGKKRASRGKSSASERLRLAAMGLEAEFVLLVDDVQAQPEDVFGDPKAFIRGELMHRVGTSYHLPTGGAVYFDTGVIELATPVIELERGAPARAGRSLWEAIRFVRQELSEWERRSGHNARLMGFSTHYNVSFDTPARGVGPHRTVGELALLLCYILPFPVMLLAANRRSTGIGVRPRGDRIEVTADFTPSPSLMIATATLIAGIVRAVMRWPTFELSELDRPGLPVVAGFAPTKHTSRKGWLARFDCYRENPFVCDVDAPVWETRSGRRRSLREIAGRTARYFWPEIRRMSDPFTLRLIGSVMRGRAPSLLDLPDRPPEYEDVGQRVMWEDFFPERTLSRSRYERVLIRAISGRKLRLGGDVLQPVGMKGWSSVVFRSTGTGERHAIGIDELSDHLEAWEK